MNKRDKKGDVSQLGKLEAEVMSVVWERGRATVQDVKDALEPRRSLAYTTIMTVMSRLAEKGMLNRQKDGRAFYYTPLVSQEKVANSLLQALIRRLYDGAAGQAIAQLLETEDGVDDKELERLEQLIRSKREAKKQ